MANPQSKRDFLQMWFDRMWNEDRPREDIEALFDEYWAEEAVADGVAGREISSKQAALALVDAFRGVFRDIHFELFDFHEFGDCVGAYTRLTMVHRERESAIDVRGHVLVRIQDGRIVEGRNSIDFVPVLEQMGALPPDALAEALRGRSYE